MISTVWKKVGSSLVKEDGRFVGLSLTFAGEEDGHHMIEVEGPREAVDLIMSDGRSKDLGRYSGPNLHAVIRLIFRGLARDLPKIDDPNWPLFTLYTLLPSGHEEVEESTEESTPPFTPDEVPPLLRVHPGGQLPDVVAAETQQEAFRRIGREVGETVVEKNQKYGNSFSETGGILRILYPSGISPDQYDDALAVVRILDKLKRIATDRDALGESPYRDIAGYGVLGTEMTEKKRGC